VNINKVITEKVIRKLKPSSIAQAKCFKLLKCGAKLVANFFFCLSNLKRLAEYLNNDEAQRSGHM